MIILVEFKANVWKTVPCIILDFFLAQPESNHTVLTWEQCTFQRVSSRGLIWGSRTPAKILLRPCQTWRVNDANRLLEITGVCKRQLVPCSFYNAVVDGALCFQNFQEYWGDVRPHDRSIYEHLRRNDGGYKSNDGCWEAAQPLAPVCQQNDQGQW